MYKIYPEQLEAILRALNGGLRVELIPLKDHVKVMIVQRTEAKVNINAADKRFS